MSNSTPPTLPLELYLHIAAYLPVGDLSVLSRTCDTLHTLLTPLLETYFTNHATSILRWAVIKPNDGYTLTERCLRHGANPDGSGDGWPPLTCAAAVGNLTAARTLLDAGADVHRADRISDYDTPVHVAHMVEREQMVRLLITYGAVKPPPPRDCPDFWGPEFDRDD